MKQTRRIVLLMLAVILPASLMAACSQQHHETEQASSETSKSNEKGETVSAKEKTDWTKPSGGEYPDIKHRDSIWIDVSAKKQEAYIKEGSKTIYTMIISSGLDQTDDDSTPKGTYYVEPERGGVVLFPRISGRRGILGVMEKPWRIPIPQRPDD